LRRDIAERALVGRLRILLCPQLCRRLVLIHFAVSGDGLVLGECRPGQEGHDHCSGDNSHARAPGCCIPHFGTKASTRYDVSPPSLFVFPADLPSRSTKAGGERFELPTLPLQTIGKTPSVSTFKRLHDTLI